MLTYEATRVSATDLLDVLPEETVSAWFAHPAQDLELAAEGVAADIRTVGPERFTTAAAEAQALFARVEVTGGGPAPLLVGGFAFADADPTEACWQGFPALHFVLPERLWIRRGDETWLLRLAGTRAAGGASSAVDTAGIPSADGTRATWTRSVRGALDAIAAGDLRKVVLARSCTRETLATARDTARRLRDARPECVTFWLQRAGRNFVGSSPEVLARVEAGAIAATALAGSAPRAGTVDDDATRAANLLVDPKNRAEHAFVANDVRRALGNLCDTVDERPIEVRSYPEAFHLATPFRGVLRSGLDLLGAAGALHPTSAVCGEPRERARAMIAEVEPGRGWYAGGVGWMDPAGQGTLAVALRCGVLTGGASTLWAGAGIVADSDPDVEYEETETKLQAMRRALADEGRAAAPVTLPMPEPEGAADVG